MEKEWLNVHRHTLDYLDIVAQVVKTRSGAWFMYYVGKVVADVQLASGIDRKVIIY